MPLPKLSVMQFKTTLESTGQEIKFRPFLVKEEKMLLMALEGGDDEEIASSITNLISSCILTEDIEVDKLPPFDIEKLFLEIRKKSVGETIEVQMRHPFEDECKHVQKVAIDLNKLKVFKDPEHNKKIKIDEKIGVVMKYPNAKMIEKYAKRDVESTFGLIIDCIEYAYDADTVYNDFSRDEMVAWIEQLNENQLSKIINFFSTMPEFRYDLAYVCDECKKEVKLELKGVKDFFT